MVSFQGCPFFSSIDSWYKASLIDYWQSDIPRSGCEGVGEVISPLSLSYSCIVGRSKWYLCEASGYVHVTFGGVHSNVLQLLH